jgi:beta-mannosidase
MGEAAGIDPDLVPVWDLGDDLAAGWLMSESAPGEWVDATAFEQYLGTETDLCRVAAAVPGTVAKALHLAGRYNPAQPRALHDSDFWYRRVIHATGEHLLQFQGLATVVEIYLDGERIASLESMFLPLQFSVRLRGESRLCIAFRSLNRHLEGVKVPRARWRVAMVPQQGLRAVRTTLLGHMPSWCPDVHLIGPWLPMRLLAADEITDVKWSASLVDDAGHVQLDLSSRPDISGANVSCAGATVRLQRTGLSTYRAELCIAKVARWWPRGMGEQTLYALTLQTPSRNLLLGKVGFREIVLDRGTDGEGFALVVNGQPVFARGAVFTPTDILHPGATAGLERRLTLLAEMGANMVRIAGPFCYESTDFYRICDALGLLVWQDLMLANFDYPFASASFVASLIAEIGGLLQRVGRSPSLAVLCGGSEIQQQAAMVGLPAERRGLPFFEEDLTRLCAGLAPQLIVVPNSPTGGELPFSVRQGVSHYFGVGAYERALEDARRAAPRFISECLAFANVPEPISLDLLGVAAVHDPAWKAAVPRDRGASWDFEDTRDHYMARVFGLDPAQLRRTDLSHYLAASRAVMAHVFSNTLAEWRRPASPTRGALVFTAGDLRLGAGWGLIDTQGEPKSTFYAFRQVCQPIALFLTDEGCDGVDIHLVNDSPDPLQMQLVVRLLRQGQTEVARGTLDVEVMSRSGLSLAANRVLGVFADVSYAFRFGTSGHDTVHVSAVGGPTGDRNLFLEACFFPQGPYSTPQLIKIHSEVTRVGGDWWLELAAESVVRFVHIDDRHYRPLDNYFHMSPGAVRRVRLAPRVAMCDQPPSGTVGALNSIGQSVYRGVA